MDKKTCLQQLSWLQELNYNELFNGGVYIHCNRKGGTITIDNDRMTINDLKAIVYWFENPEEFGDL